MPVERRGLLPGATLLPVAAALPSLPGSAAAQPASSASTVRSGIPPQITTPDSVQTRLGTLTFRDGVPSRDTAARLYDYLDFSRAVDTFLNAFSGVSMYAIRQGFRDAGVRDNDILIFSELMDSRSLFLTANADTIYFWGYLDLSAGPIVVETPPDTLGIFDDMWFRWIVDFGLAGPDRGLGAGISCCLRAMPARSPRAGTSLAGRAPTAWH